LPVCEKDKQFGAVISFVVIRVGLGEGEITRWYFEFVHLKMRF
jgi:hypothetical protein